MEYRLVFLTPGQQAPKGSTGRCLSNGGVVWIGEEGTFNENALLGHRLPTDPIFNAKYDNKIMTQDEMDEYNLLLKYMDVVKDGYGDLISFEDFKDSGKLANRQIEIKNEIDAIVRS